MTAFGPSNRFLCHATCGTHKLAGRFPLEHTRREEKPLRKQLLILATFALIINSGVAFAQQETPQQFDKSGASSGTQGKHRRTGNYGKSTKF